MRILSILCIPVGLLGLFFSASFAFKVYSAAQEMRQFEDHYLGWVPDMFHHPIDHVNDVMTLHFSSLIVLFTLALLFLVGGVLVVMRKKAGLWLLRVASGGSLLSYGVYVWLSHQLLETLPFGFDTGYFGDSLVWMVTIVGGIICAFPMILFIVLLFPPADYFSPQPAEPVIPPPAA